MEGKSLGPTIVFFGRGMVKGKEAYHPMIIAIKKKRESIQWMLGRGKRKHFVSGFLSGRKTQNNCFPWSRASYPHQPSARRRRRSRIRGGVQQSNEA